MSDISRIKVKDQVYDIKDALLRHQINVLLGLEEPNEQEENKSSENK